MVVYTKYPLNLQYASSEERITSGIDGLDERMEGGILRGSTTAVVGASGVGKTSFAFQFIAEGVKNGQPGIFFSLEESPNQIARMASKFGYDVQELQTKGLTIISKVAEETSIDSFISELTKLVVEKKPVRLAIDSISAFEHAYSQDVYTVTKRIVSLAHDNEITTIFTILTEQKSGLALTTIGISSLFENIIMLRYVEMEGRMKRSILLFKMRATAHDESILEFKITNKGISIIREMSDYVGIMTGVAQRIRKDFEDQEQRIAKEEADARKKRLEVYEAKQKSMREAEDVNKAD
jgi:circadian clock protein KaiC